MEGRAKSEIGARLDALDGLLTEPSHERRRELLRDASEVFFAPQPVAPEILALFDSALERMTFLLEGELRRELAARLPSAAHAPRRLIARLVGDDDPEVATPLLKGAAELTEADLLRVTGSGGQWRLRAAAGRTDLTEPVSGQIVERGDDETVAALLGNPCAPLSREASEAVTDRALASPALHEAVVSRESFPVDLLNEMYLVVEQRLRDRIAARTEGLDAQRLEEALVQARTRLATREGALPADYPGSEAQVLQMRRAGALSPGALAAFARYGETTKFMIALGLQANVDFGAVRRTLERQDGEAFALLCKAAGYENDLFRTLLILLKPTGEDSWQPVMNRYLTLSRDTAQRIVRFWSVRRSAALAA